MNWEYFRDRKGKTPPLSQTLQALKEKMDKMKAAQRLACMYLCVRVCIYVCMFVWMDGWMDVLVGQEEEMDEDGKGEIEEARGGE